MSGKEIFSALATVLIGGSVLAVIWGLITQDFAYMTSVGFVFFLVGFLSLWIAEAFRQLVQDKRWKHMLNMARRREQLLAAEEEEEES